ncbi:glycoside hydrolase family 68 protein, partial [Bacillus vallismortis]|nr:glycoside hydrolase family 68 protein [Bacillus vallismortis]
PCEKFDANDSILKDHTLQWSGSATFTSDGHIRFFYTDFSGKHYGKQTLTTAQVKVSTSDSSLNIDGVEDYKSIFEGD